MDKRTIVAFLLILLVAFLYPTYNRLFVTQSSKPSSAPQNNTTANDSTPHFANQSASRALTTPEIINQVPAGPQAAARPAPVKDEPPVPEQTVDIETELYSTQISTRGMTITSFKCKKYFNDKKEWVELIPDKARGTLDISIQNGAQEINFANSIYKVNKNKVLLNDATSSDTLIFTLAGTQGFTLTKTVIFYNKKYYFDTMFKMSWEGKMEAEEYSLYWLPGLATTETDINRDHQGFASCYKKVGEKVTTKSYKGNSKTDRGRIEWLATKTKYFVFSICPLSLLDAGKSLGIEIKEKEADKADPRKVVSLYLKAPLENGITRLYRVYLGPLDYPMLKDMEIGMENILDFGWIIIRPISVIIYKFCVWMYPYFYNYGVVIIIFSIILKVLFYPLTAKSYSAAKDMQKLQPLMAELKVKYKNDPQTLNKETMKLYKEQKINPLGGCLPMLPQMPIFFALFKVFDNSIEFRQAGFVWWLDDLSRKDPTFVLPLVMGATMFIQQKMSTNVMDEKQKIMLYTMPIIFTFIFMSLSSGLILYYTVFNILSIVQQYLINRAEKTAKAAVPAAPAVRK